MKHLVLQCKSVYQKAKFYARTWRLSSLLRNFLCLALALILTVVVYNHVGALNEFVFVFIRIGSVGLLTGVFFMGKYLYNIGKWCRYRFRNLGSGYQLMVLALLVALAFGFYLNQDKYVPKIFETVSIINFSYLNPLSVELNASQDATSKSSEVTGSMVVENQQVASKNSVLGVLEAIIPSSEPISEKTKKIEQKILEYTNQERSKYGKQPLRWDSKLADVARDHSLDMANNNFFDHVNLKGEDPTDRALRHGYDVHKELGGGWFSDGIAENIGEMPTGSVTGYGYVSNDPDSIAAAQVSSWMNSPGHRANILEDKYDVLGVGVAYDGQYYVSTQDFK